MRRTRLVVPFALASGLAASAVSAATFTVDFNPDSPAHTNGWDFGTTVTNGTKSGTQPGGRKFAPGKANSASIESPLYPSSISSVALSAWGSGINSGNTSKLEVFGRATTSDDYQHLFTRISLANTLAGNEPYDKFTITDDLVPTDFVCHQLKITYTQDIGSWTLATVTLTDDSASDGGETEGDDSDGDTGGDGETDDGATLAAPGDVRAGLLPDGRIRLGWTTPDGATNVTLRLWTLATEGGLAESEADDILWRETFVSAPATNSSVAVSDDEKFALYTDKKSDGWDIGHCVKVSLAPDAGAVKIGTGEKFGALVSKALDLSAENLTLVVTAKHYGDNPNVILRTASLAADGSSADGSSEAVVTNELGQTTLTADFAEYAFPIKRSPTGNAALLIESLRGTSDKGRVILDDIALVRSYTSVQTVTNEVASLDLGADDDEHELDAADGVVRYVALCAQDATGASSAWTETLTLDPDTLGEWKDRHLTLNSRGKVAMTLDWTALPAATDAKLDVSDSPFRFLIDGAERLEISRNKDVTKSFSVGVYVCTNVFERDWIVLTPYSAETKADVRTAEMRVAIETGEFAVRRLAISGMFAQLGASNTDERALEFQWRCLVTDAATKVVTATDWQAFNGTSGFATTYTAADVAEDADFGAKLRETITNVTAEATLRLPDGTRPKAGARIEVSILNRRGIDQKEAPLGFREVSISAESGDSGAIFLVH